MIEGSDKETGNEGSARCCGMAMGRLHKMVGKTGEHGTCAMVKETWGKMGKLGKTLISFQVGEAGCEGFAWCAVTEGSKKVMRSSDE